MEHKGFVPSTGLVVMVIVCFLAIPGCVARLKSSGTHLLVHQDSSVLLNTHHQSSLFRHRRDSPEDSTSAVEVRQFHLSSKLHSRFATVTIESEVLNAAEEGSKETAFRVQVPETAFMSNFTMVVDGQLFVAQVLEKEAAEKKYQEAKEKNQTAGQVKHDPTKPERGMELFIINVNLAPRGNATFTLVYNELLERRGGTYRQRMVVQPGSIVANMSVRAYFAERQGFQRFAYMLPGSDKQMTASSAVDQTQMQANVNSRELVFTPTVQMQHNFDAKKGIHGEFVIIYSVNNEPGGGSIIVQNDYFAHFFAPPGLTPLPKNVLFIIDISGSMSGDKIQQARDAMLRILDDMKTYATDTFNILLFSDGMELWQQQPKSTLNSEIEAAKGFVREKLKSQGGTNIYDALMEGLGNLLPDNSEISCDPAKLIVFLTDGDPTSGVTNITRIINDVANKNQDRASIFSLGFGFNMNFDFLNKISDKNRGFARRIYAESDAGDQLTNFYDEISNPILCNVVARYGADVVDSNLLTVTTVPLFFNGREMIVAGKTKASLGPLEPSTMNAELHGIGVDGQVNFVVPVGKIETLDQPDVEDDLTEKLWAYMKIKNLLKAMDNAESETEKNKTQAQALNMSLTYGFVTRLTSFSIVVEDRPSGNNYEASDKYLMRSRPTGKYDQGKRYINNYAGNAPIFTLSWGMVSLSLLAVFINT